MKRRHCSLIRQTARVTALSAALALTACDQGSNESVDYVADAEQSYIDGDYKSGVIQAKSALQQDPRNISARYLLAEIYLKIGDGVSAEKELRRAISLGMNEAENVFLLVDALRLQGKHQEVIEQTYIANRDMKPADKARLLAYRGDAWLARDDMDAAQALYEEALVNDADSIQAKLGAARIVAANGGNEDALRMVNDILATSPEYIDALRFAADIQKLQGENEKAEANYSAVIERGGNTTVARGNRALVRIDMGKLDAAEQDITILKKVAPAYFLTHFADGVLEFSRGDYEKALPALLKAQQLSKKYKPTYYYLGVVYLQLNQLRQAEESLSIYQKEFPDSVLARQMLAKIKFELDYPEKAKTILAPALEQQQNDPFSRNLMADIEESMGNRYEAGRLPAQAEILDLVELIRDKKYDEAIDLSRQLQEQFPGNSTLLTLMAGAYVGKEDPATAKELLGQALEADPNNANAVYNLTRLEVADGNLEQAKSLYENFLQQRPNDMSSLLLLANIVQKQGDVARAKELIERAMEHNPNDLWPRQLLGDYYLRRGQPQKSLAVTREILDVYPLSIDLWSLVGRARLAAGDPSGGAVAFERLVELQPDSVSTHLLLAKAYSEAKNERSARAELEKILVLDPKNTIASNALVRLLTLAGEQERVDDLVERLKKDFPNSEAPYKLEAWVAQQRKQSSQQVAAVFLGASRIFPDSNSWPLDLAEYQWNKGSQQSAFATLEKWLVTHPDDFQVMYAVGNYHLLLDQPEQALAAFESAYEHDPNNALLLNNLAWLLREKDTGRALAFAERAHDLVPDWVAATDTLAMILVGKGQTERAIALLRDATDRAPKQADVGYHLAVALARNGDKIEARKVLSELLDREEAFLERDNARALLDEIGK